ncbi:hypothetical protein PybrP1_003551, partial [[Pythium] brassicae (nom. inval.)]
MAMWQDSRAVAHGRSFAFAVDRGRRGGKYSIVDRERAHSEASAQHLDRLRCRSFHKFRSAHFQTRAQATRCSPAPKPPQALKSPTSNPTMVNALTVVATAAFLATASAAPMPTGTWPTSKGTVKFDKPFVVKVGKPFDGGMMTYERSNVQCTGDNETGWASAVFLVEPGAILKNVIIGKNQAEGVHCENG